MPEAMKIRAVGMTLDTVETAIRRHTLAFTGEGELQELLATILAPLGASREVRIDRANRIDFLVDRVGVECKVGG